MISVANIVKKFGQTVAVNDISFTTKKGEIIGFLGPNGAGKTTTIRLILGLIKPTSGTITVEKSDPIKDRLDVLTQIGYLPENNPLYGEMKVSEYLQFIAEMKRVSDPLLIDEIVKDVSIDDKYDVKIEELSRGYRQRVGLATALLGDPNILILDEPTSGLDPIEQDKIKNLIKKVAKKKIVIFSTHILSEVEDIANRLIIINKGKIVYDGKKPARKGSVETLFKKLVK
ncbi:multidrug ABC transporter ATP-binding protein [Candidatus Roizmanbacteria bacterium CG_4_9_14_0_2_um_filter_39_13]|uniref:Multidrug ABC transporter ATP-binding protein n=2 Tax=Candidatus Roizmaniibacteriota TaxID=1752723 RepID=A0A2M8F3M3_9BACT|nr:MAG: multidrug ABC transporter ATP-binding protein [Candidatus Roizmanbacteria bacterium CG_4_10_14_0_2_um_filter_39_12]PJC33903.1 MAG: multidrug ABC transporter ATP-binding protein [Candidatus Roizmanbacteria bacterium CG_4_9_14_0_2_um_filter_39_13]PJE61758.1 MAG: multidrug ABC transporter ATP-binding protein [Candidatus Roizmanbacteria bacterium CG10_big_fil_rev_8_21_14_0_10_39_12]